ncbi:MAG: Ig-like domain-containing protein [Chloroflexota bacterium]|nr:Ig-like domain-containing protein [Chloroflexota bacterium]
MERKTAFPILVVILVLLFSLAISACATPPPESGTGGATEPATAPRVGSPENDQLPSSDTQPEPTNEGRATGGPVQDLPPTVIGTTPEMGQEHPLDAPIVIRFDQTMDAQSTVDAFSIEPEVAGTARVRGTDLVFTPKESFDRGQSFQLSVNKSATAVNGKLLASPVQLRFNTAGFLEVTSSQPAAGSQNVSIDTPITVVFNRPVVPLTGLDQADSLPQPLTFEPAVIGEGQWLTTSIYTFQPETPLAGATDYVVTVSAGLQDTTGGLLVEDTVIDFHTASPIVIDLLPAGQQVFPTTAISVTFSQPMDNLTSEAAFSLRNTLDDMLIDGSNSWSANDRVMHFKPHSPLAYDTAYVAQINDGARSAGGGSLREDFQARFETAPVIAVVDSDPADGQESVSPERDLKIGFQGVVDDDTLNGKTITILPEPTSVFSYFSRYENRWIIRWPMLPQTPYEIILDQEIADVFGNTLDEDVEIRFSTGNRKPFAHLTVPNEIGTYDAYTNTLIAASFRNVSRLDFDLFSVSEADTRQLLGPDQWESRHQYQPEPDALIRQWSAEVAPEVNANMLEKFPLAEDGGPLDAGIYWLEMRAPEVRYRTGPSTPGQEVSRHLLVVSPLNLIVKKTADEVLVWVTDLKSGLPVPDLPVRVTGPSGIAGNSDSDGVFRGPVKLLQPWQPLTVFAGTEAPTGSFSPRPYGVVSTDWQQGLSPWDFDLRSEFPPPEWQGYFYTDRPIYRPGQTVFWKGAIRKDQDTTYFRPDTGTELEITIQDGQGNQVFKGVEETNLFGTLHGEFALDEEAGLGSYRLEARLLDAGPASGRKPSFSHNFQVAEYRKPEFEIELFTDQDEYLQGESVAVDAEARYFFGSPVPNARVVWSVFSSDSYFNFTGDSGGTWYSFSDYRGWDPREHQKHGGPITSGVGETDRQGRFSFEFVAEIADKPQSQRFSIDVRVVDASDQEVSANAGVTIHKALVYPGIAPRDYVGRVGKSSAIDLITVDWQSQPVPGQPLSILVSKADWKTVQEKAEDGRFYWVTRVEETPLITETLSAGEDGEAVFAWTPEAGGQYKISVDAVDEQGNRARAAAFQWISDEPAVYVSWQVENNDRIDLIANSPIYQVGEIAEVLVPHPYQGNVEALVTIERGSIIDVERITLTGNSETLQIPIEASYVPNVYVSVVVIKGQGTEGNDLGSFKLGYVELPVDTSTRELQVNLTASQVELKPGDPVTFTLEVSDHDGQPVQSEFSMALVDKAVLSLSRADEPTMVEAFYRQRGLGVQTASTLVYNLDRLNLQLREGAKGGGGGSADESMFDVRSEFQDTAFWEPAIVTGADGKATVSITLPDNLTTWQLDSRGLSNDTKVGQAKAEIITTLPLLVRPVVPRFFVAGDRAEIGAIVHNNTDALIDVVVEIEASGLEIDGELAKPAAIEPFGQVRVSWPVKAISSSEGASAGETLIRFTAWELTHLSDALPLRDGVEVTIPVYRYSSPETVGTAGTVALGEERLEVIVLPPNIDPEQGDLRIVLEPSLAAGMIGSLEWLELFPYECNEQIVSKFLPNLVAYRSLTDLQLDDPELADNLQSQISIALQKLLQRQNPDGGWGWWGGEESQAFVTSYVVYGLVEAGKAGFHVDQDALDRGLDALDRSLEPVDDLEGWRLNQQAFSLYVLAEAGHGDMARSVGLFEVRERLAHYGRALLALDFGLLEQKGELAARARIDTLLEDLTGAAILSATGAHWEEEAHHGQTMSTDTRSTSMVLSALSRLQSDHALAPNVVRWLMSARKSDRWQTTQENVWAIIALTDWMVATGELEADYSYLVAINGDELADGTATQENLDTPVELRVAMQDLFLNQANALTISRFATAGQSGEGQLYYTSHLNTYLPAADLEARDRGIVLAREVVAVDPVTGEAGDRQVSEAAAGDILQVTLTIIAPNDLNYLVVESPLPAGTEAIDTSLATTSQTYQGPRFGSKQEQAYPGFWWWTPTHNEIRDEKVVLFATALPAGTYQYSYQMRASLPGDFHVLPATAQEMYFPEVWGRSGGSSFTVIGD